MYLNERTNEWELPKPVSDVCRVYFTWLFFFSVSSPYFCANVCMFVKKKEMKSKKWLDEPNVG